MTSRRESFKFLDILAALFVAFLLVAQTVASKILVIGGLTLNGGAILIPFNFILGDVFTEVYGYNSSRRVIWLGFLCASLMSLVYWLVGILPPAPEWEHQQAYEKILSVVPRIVAASLTAYCVGEFSNSYILAKMKIWTQGKYLWTRTIGSTVIGQGVDTILFAFIAFYGLIPLSLLISLAWGIYLFKVLVEVIVTPLTYKVVGFLKAAEGIDYYDRETNFNPLAKRIAEEAS